MTNKEFERAWRNIICGERLILEGRDSAFIRSRGAGLSAEVNLRLRPDEEKPILDVLGSIDQEKDNDDEITNKIIEDQGVFEEIILFLNDTRERISGRLAYLSFALIAFTVAFGFYYYSQYELLNDFFTMDGVNSAAAIDNAAATIEMTPPKLLAAFLLGAIGACVSAILSYTALNRVPGAFEGFWITIARPFVGAISGVVAIMFVNASLFEFKSGAAMALMSFVFGFSERLIIGTVDRLQATQEMQK